MEILDKEVFAYLSEAGLKVKFAKCEFLKAKITLDHTVDRHGIHIMNDKISAIEHFPEPQ